MDTYIVMPCLNEAAQLAQTCASLGFPGERDAQTHLVLVDNGSEDQTLEVMRGIRAACDPQTVHILEEPRRGYVAARSAGPTYLASSGLASPSALLLQADADTVYLPGYVRQMKHDAWQRGRGHLFEAAAVTAAEFRRKYLVFDELCRAIDAEMGTWAVRDEDDVVVDDKVSGFFLADYFDWGGHFVERMQTGEELLAESTRLFIMAKQARGARKVKVAAMALPSRRKLATQAVAYFASAGFPRGPKWNAQWSDEACGSAADFLENPQGSPCIAAAASSRRRHLLALFGLLPLLVDGSSVCRAELREFRLSLPAQPAATALERALTLADDEDGSLHRFVAQHPGSQPL